ncbi:MAG: acyl-CoA dehydrogenase family protein [Chloroflexi bacterium]|nr:acyl-CoA dehydrogenase family protein [Chloroflexota bacterium]
MDFNLTEEQKMVKQMARDFADKEIEPIAQKIDEESKIPADMAKKLGSVGLMAPTVPAKYGGAGMKFIDYILIVEQLGYSSIAVETLMGIHSCMAELIDILGNEEQKKKYLPKCCTGEALSSIMFTEPETGSDPKMITTNAVQKGDKFIVNGTKRFITLAQYDGPGVLFAKDDSGRVSTFILEKNGPGYSTEKPWKLMGVHGGLTVDVLMDNVEIPAANRLGKKGYGYRDLRLAISLSKTRLSARNVGAAQAALDETIRYAKERKKQGEAISKMPSIQWLIAEMVIRVEAARLMCYKTACMRDEGKDIVKESAMTKLFVAQATDEIASMGIQVHGAYGYCQDYKIERLFRDIRLLRILEGTDEIQRAITAGYTLI